MNKIAKISIAGGAVALAAAASAFAIMLTKDKQPVPTVSVLDVSDIPSVTEPAVQENWWEKEEYSLSPSGMNARGQEYLAKNDDIIGWIKLDKTKINYPVVLDPGDVYSEDDPSQLLIGSNSYYLDKDIDGKPYISGTLFMDYRDVFSEKEDEQSDNLVIYGHNMLNNTAFGGLRVYRQNYSFYDESPIIELSSNYRDYQYIIFGYIITPGSYDDTDFHYWNMEDFANEEEFNFFVDRIQSNSMVDTGVDVKYGDKLLTLSTCYLDEDNSRFIVVARRLRDHETSLENIDRTEAYLEKIRQEEASRAAAEAEAEGGTETQAS